MRFEVYSAVNEISNFIDATGVDKCRVWKVLDSLGIDPNDDVPRWFGYWIYRLLKNSENGIEAIIKLDCSHRIINFDANTVVNESIKSAFKKLLSKHKEYVDALNLKEYGHFMLTVGYSAFGCIISGEIGFDYSSRYPEFKLAKEILRDEFEEGKQTALIDNLSVVIYEFVIDVIDNGEYWGRDKDLSLRPVNDFIVNKKKNIIRDSLKNSTAKVDIKSLLIGNLAANVAEDRYKKLERLTDEIYEKSLLQEKEDKNIVSSHDSAEDILNFYNDQEDGFGMRSR